MSSKRRRFKIIFLENHTKLNWTPKFSDPLLFRVPCRLDFIKTFWLYSARNLQHFVTLLSVERVMAKKAAQMIQVYFEGLASYDIIVG